MKLNEWPSSANQDAGSKFKMLESVNSLNIDLDIYGKKKGKILKK